MEEPSGSKPDVAALRRDVVVSRTSDLLDPSGASAVVHALFSRLHQGPGVKILNRTEPHEHAAVFSAQHLKGFIRGNTIWTRTPTDPVQPVKDRAGHSVSSQF